MRERNRFGRGILVYVFAGLLIWGLVELKDTEFGREGLIGYVTESARQWDWDSLYDVGGFREAVDGKELIDKELDKSMDVLNGL